MLNLTSRQADILELIAQGYSNKAIAGRLRLTQRTVENHTRDLYDRMGIRVGRDQSPRVLAALKYKEEEFAWLCC